MRGLSDKVVAIAERQHGRIAWRQLIDAGIDRGRVQRWIDDGRLRPVHHGVYALGHAAPSLRAAYMAAVLAGGPGAALSHFAAAHLLRLLAGAAGRPEITVPTLAGRQRPGIIIHRAQRLNARDVFEHDGIAVTIVPRVLLDLAPRLEAGRLTRACHEAWVHHRTTPRHVEACIARNPHKPGAAKLRAALGSDVTLSVLEDRFLALLRAHGLPAPRTNVDHRGDKVDCHWPQAGLTVELLSYRFHASRGAFEADVARRRRSGHLAFTYGDVFERGPQTVTELKSRLLG